MENTKLELRIEELQKVNGGEWDLNSLTEEEAREYECLWGYFVSNIGYPKEGKAHQAVLDFERRMDEKYGPNIW